MPKKILVVDDEPDILEISTVRLEKMGYDVIKVVDAESAIEALEKTRPDLILLDLLLPKMQGDEFCKKIKADPKYADIPVILFTASILRVPSKVREMGADDYIMKPFEPRDLIRKVQKYIG